MDKLEQVSENPELKQEMEAEVASTNSNQVSYIGVKVRIFVILVWKIIEYSLYLYTWKWLA